MPPFSRFLWSVAPLAFTFTVAACASGPGETVGTTSSASTFPNDKPAYDYFVGKGLTSFQAAGIVGNLDQESGVDPTAAQGGGPGRGIAQWSVGGRWDTDANDNATSYATQEGLPLLSLQLQLDFIWYELQTFPSYGLADLQATTNVTDATVVFETDFEGCGECDQATRVMYAETVLAAFGSSTPDAAPPAQDDAGGGGDDAGIGTACVVGATGESGVCMTTDACAILGGTSTADLCPGPADVQCCTGAMMSPDASVATGGDASTHHAGSSASGSVIDAAAPGSHSGGSGHARAESSAASDQAPSAAASSGGCSASPTAGDPTWLVSLAGLALVGGRRRRSGTHGARWSPHAPPKLAGA